MCALKKERVGAQGKVCALHAVGNIVISGGDDGVVRTWKASDLSPLTTTQMPPGPSREPACVRSVFADSSVSILVGTKSNEIWEITDKPRMLHQVRVRARGEVRSALPPAQSSCAACLGR
jgi:hypothetical protein